MHVGKKRFNKILKKISHAEEITLLYRICMIVCLFYLPENMSVSHLLSKRIIKHELLHY